MRVRLERAVLREVRLALREPFETSRGRVHERRVLLLTLHGEELEGWGECVVGADPSYTAETVESTWEILSLALPGLTGLEDASSPPSGDTEPASESSGTAFVRGGEVQVPLIDPGRCPMAYATLEMALRDLAARGAGMSLASALGGTRERVPVGISLGLAPSVESLAERVGRSLEEGYARVKLKIAPGRDASVLAYVRGRFPKAVLSADANGAYTLADAPLLKELDALDLQMLEQPLARDRLADHARLQERMRTPICLDESIASEAEAAEALALGSCRVMSLKPGRLGGHRRTVRIHDAMRAAGMPVWCGGMLETGIGRAHNLALASLPGFTLPGDISASRRYWERDIVSPEHVVEDGHMRVPTGLGIGVEVDVERVEALTVRTATFD